MPVSKSECRDTGRVPDSGGVIGLEAAEPLSQPLVGEAQIRPALGIFTEPVALVQQFDDFRRPVGSIVVFWRAHGRRLKASAWSRLQLMCRPAPASLLPMMGRQAYEC